MNMEKSDEILLNNMKMLKKKLIQYQEQQWRAVKSKYLQELHGILKDNEKL